MLCHENQWNAQSLSQKFDVTIEFSYEIFPAPLFVSFWSGAVDVVGGYRNDVIFGRAGNVLNLVATKIA